MTSLTVGGTVPIFRERLLQELRDDPGRRWLTVSNAAGEATFTHAQLHARIADFTRLFRDSGIRRGDVVLIVLRESLDLFASFLAGIVAGATPAYFAYPSPKHTTEAFLASFGRLLEVTEIALLVSYADVVGRRFQPPSRLGRVVDAATVPSAGLTDTVVLDGDDGPEAFLQFSSGTTGVKKGVRISTRALFAQMDAYGEYVQFGPGSTVVSWLPPYHDMGLIACMLMPLLQRVPIVMLSPFEWVRRPGILLEAATRHRATHMWLPNFALGHLTRTVPDEALTTYDLTALQQLVCCSEPVNRTTVRGFIDRFRVCGLAPEVVRNCYAMAENTFAVTSTTGPVTFLDVDPAALSAQGSAAPQPGGKAIACAGRPLRNVELRILDDDGRPAAPGRVGEIAVRTDCMLDEYFRNPGATLSTVVDGWLLTGDLGFVHGGAVYITGRKKDLIIVGGENIYPQDIEAILDATPGLVPGRNVVFGIDDEDAGTERIVVLAEIAPDAAPPDALHLQRAVFEQIGVSVAECRLLARGTLRKSTAGKVSRALNREAYLAGAFEPPIAAPPADDITRLVMRSLSGPVARPISIETPLLSSGLIDSLAFTGLVLELERAYGIQIPVEAQDRAHFDTVGRIAQTVSALQAGSHVAGADAPAVLESRASSLETLLLAPPRRYAWQPGMLGVIERLINKCPVPSSRLYRFLLRRAGLTIGSNVVFLGRFRVRLEGNPALITIGDDVVVGDNVEMRNREQGRLVIGSRARLDDDVRLIAARDGCIEIGEGAAIGRGTIVNSGGTTRIGRYAMVSSYVSINASTHDTDRASFICAQPFRHGVVEIGDDVWVGASAVIVLNCWIGEGAVIESNTRVTGRIPAFAVYGGAPPRVERYR